MRSGPTDGWAGTADAEPMGADIALIGEYWGAAGDN
jgi:hypothetical protein